MKWKAHVMSHHGAHFRLERPKSIETDALCALYDALGWSAYTKDPEKLAAAVAGSSFVVTAVADNQLIGLARCISQLEVPEG